MKITDIKPYAVWVGRRNQMLVKIETDEGIHGWGESGFSGRELGVKGIIQHYREFLKGKDAMIHISELQWKRTENVEDILNVGDEVKAKCVEYDSRDGKTRMSVKQMTEPPPGAERSGPPRGKGGPPRHGGGRPPRR